MSAVPLDILTLREQYVVVVTLKGYSCDYIYMCSVCVCVVAACVGVHVCVGGRTSHAPRHSMPTSMIPK